MKHNSNSTIKQFNNRLPRGFTLIELLVVVAVLGILAGGILTALNITGTIGKASLTRAKRFAAQLENGLAVNQVGKWSFEGNANDTSGYGNIGSFFGGAAPTLSCNNLGLGQCLSLNGSSTYISVGDPANESLDFGTGDFSLSAWFYLPSLPGDWKSIINKGASGAGGYSMEISDINYPSCSMQQTAGGINRHVSGASIPSVKTWHHLLCVFDRDGNITVYLNGAVNGSFNTSAENTGSISNTQSFSIGRDYNASWYFDGLIDEVQIYKEALTLSEIEYLYAQGIVRRVLSFRF